MKSRVYDAYGTVRAEDAAYSQSNHRFVGTLGHPSESETGLIYMRARYMDPETGRFVSEDPGADGNNWFVYCNNDPVNRVDITGRFPISVGEFFAIYCAIDGINSFLENHDLPPLNFRFTHSVKAACALAGAVSLVPIMLALAEGACVPGVGIAAGIVCLALAFVACALIAIALINAVDEVEMVISGKKECT